MASDRAPTRQVALVTGSAKRLGRAIALGLAEDGFDLALHHFRSGDEAEALRREIEALGRRTCLINGDLAAPEGASSIVEAGRHGLGPISLLVNNASLFEQDSLESLTLESWRRLTDVNLAAQIFLMQAFAAQPDLPDGASIINMLDQQMAAPNPKFFSYAVAKIGLEGATKLAAFELAPRVRVNGIAPGLVLPSWLQTEAKHRQRQQRMPLGEGLGPGDIVRAVRYLVSARHVTGEVLTVDSGQSLVGPGNSRLAPGPGR
ncbi:MAG: SDR family oxidoreductase [Alphaproteobacteria bacterium]|nr:SDR family oxidoreductase [Alphaproteobacteria bacterium]